MINKLPWRADGWIKEGTSGLILDANGQVVAICPKADNAHFILECVTKQTTINERTKVTKQP